MINEELKTLRLTKGITQAQLADRLNITTSSYCRKENGKLRFSLKEAKILARIFNKSVEELFIN